LQNHNGWCGLTCQAKFFNSVFCVVVLFFLKEF
jgi:hypothetical protein